MAVRRELSGEIETFAQEGGFAYRGVTVDGEDLGEAIARALGAGGQELVSARGKITMELEGEPTVGGPGSGFLRQAGRR